MLCIKHVVSSEYEEQQSTSTCLFITTAWENVFTSITLYGKSLSFYQRWIWWVSIWMNLKKLILGLSFVQKVLQKIIDLACLHTSIVSLACRLSQASIIELLQIVFYNIIHLLYSWFVVWIPQLPTISLNLYHWSQGLLDTCQGIESMISSMLVSGCSLELERLSVGFCRRWGRN